MAGDSEGILFQEGDIVEHGERRRRRRSREPPSAAPRSGGESLGIGSLREAAS